MYTKRALYEILFGELNPNYILSRLILEKDNLNKVESVELNSFYRSSQNLFSSYNKNEIELLYNGANVSEIFENLEILFKEFGNFTGDLLEYNEYEPRVKYEKLMRWNKIAHALGQDLLSTSFLAYQDSKHNDWTRFFSYRPILETTNRQLHNLLQNGMAENHFHLKGSTQVFHLNWISLMNYPLNRKKEFENLQEELYTQSYEPKTTNLSLYQLIQIAAVIRAYLYYKSYNYNPKSQGTKKFFTGCMSLKKFDLEQFMHNLSSDISSQYIIDKVWGRIDPKKNVVLFDNQRDLDYSLFYVDNHLNNTNNNFVFSGERRLLYVTIYQLINGELNQLEKRLFYLYILIKNKFRKELIQANKLTGFSNFSDYETRKELFIEKYKKYRDALISIAVANTFDGQNIVSLEARITPKPNAIANINYVKYIDNLTERQEKVFYVYHFIKKKEKPISNVDSIEKVKVLNCRNYKVRQEVEEQAKAIALALERNSNYRNRIRGIDACNNEFFCRPEVFGQAFRFLSRFHFATTDTQTTNPVEIYKTFHAGEDFFDVADGLRAIDEAIVFCDLKRGSRIGHATALGIDVDNYYKKKDRIILKKQDLIDTIAWVVYKIRYFRLDKSKYECVQQLKYDYHLLFDEVYGGTSTTEQYYDSWLLRGDNPEFYKDGRYKSQYHIKKYDMYGINTRVENTKRTEKAVNIYLQYHYDYECRKKGEEMIEFQITPSYIKLIKDIQKKMQFEISKLGIAIECNPTSNYLISQFGQYAEHPIFSFYNYELENGMDRTCPQMNVSINTDDQGVFDTSLENEYALIAYAAEFKMDNNERKYTPMQVYKWIDSIRKMGIEQKFK